MLFRYGKMSTGKEKEVKIIAKEEDGSLITDTEDERCPYCGEKMHYMSALLKKKEGGYLEDDTMFECIQVKEDGYNGCGAKFSVFFKEDPESEFGYRFFIGDEIGYDEQDGVTSCSSVVYPEYNSWRG